MPFENHKLKTCCGLWEFRDSFMKNKLKSIALFSLAVSILSGCSSSHELRKNEPDAAVVRLAQVAESIQAHSNDLADIEATRYKENRGKEFKKLSTEFVPGLHKVVSLGSSYHGPLDKIVDKLASLAGLEPLYMNIKPAGDVMVDVDTNYRRIVDMLHDIGTQAGYRAKITVKARSKFIIVEYIPY